MATDRELLDQIKERSKPIFEHFLEIDLRYRETSVRCPFHGEDNRPSMGVNFQKGMFNCLACGAAGDVITFVMRLEGASFPQALKLCCEIAGIDDRSGRSADPSVKRKAEQRQEEAELLGALRAWYSRTAMHKAALAHRLDSELYAQEKRLSLVTEEQKQSKKALFCVMESYAESLRCQLALADSDHNDFMAASDDLHRMALLFARENGLKYRPTTVREMNDAIKAIWDASFEDRIDPSQAPRLEQLLALSVLRQLDNAKMLEHLGRGWYTDVLLPDLSNASARPDPSTHGQLFDELGADRAPEGRRDTLECEELERRALAQRAEEAVRRAEEDRAVVKSVGEAFTAELRRVYGEVDAG